MEPLIVKKSIELGKASRWNGLREVTVVEETFKLPGLMDETQRFMTWARLGRQTAVRRRAAGTTHERARLEIAGFASLSVRYPTVHDPNEYIRETVHSTDKWYYGQYTDWAKSRFDTVLLRYGGDDEGGTMSNRRIARILLIF